MTPPKILSYLVPPGKSNPNPEEVRGTEIPPTGKLATMLIDAFLKADKECDIPIRFVPAVDGQQQNEVRTRIIELIKSPTLQNGQVLAERLRNVTTGKSGLGLLFLMVGADGPTNKIVISRFPADQGILAEARRGTLEVEFVERIFMKSAATYKSAIYKGKSLDAGFWWGYSVDKQINAGLDQLRLYWIRDFLASDFKTTSKEGRKCLAVALKSASKAAPSIAAKQEIISAMVLTQGMAGKAVTIQRLMSRFRLSDEARSAVEGQVHNDTVLQNTFQLDLEEFKRHATYETVELDNGAILTAPAEEFDQTFLRELINEANERYRFSTTGSIVEQRIKSRR